MKMTDQIEEGTTEPTTYELSHFGTVTVNGDGTGSIDGAMIDDRPDEWQIDPFHAAVDALFGLALFHAIAGVDVAAPGYTRGFEAQMNALLESHGD